MCVCVCGGGGGGSCVDYTSPRIQGFCEEY